MANEATLFIQTELPIPYTCAVGTGIEKGTFCQLTDPMTALAHSAINQVAAGIAAEEKIANDGKNKIAIHTDGYFKVTASGTIAIGDPLALAATPNLNQVYSLKYVTGLSGSCSVGTAQEAATTGETFVMKLNITPYWS